mgnify:FL=1
MNYVSGLMLGASVANMLRQMLGAGSTSGFAGQGMGGGRGRAMQDGNLSSGAASLGNFSSGASAFSSLFGSMGRMGGNTPLLHAGASDKNAVPQRASDPSVSPFAVVHASSGRRRYRTPYLTPEFAKVLEELLPRLPFVTALRANAVSGSILIIYPPEDEAHILVLAEGLEAIFAEGRTAPPPATVAQSVRRSVRDFSGWIQRHTGGALDLSSLVAVIFVLRGIRQLLLTNNTPSGSQMLWWALTLMRGWKV